MEYAYNGTTTNTEHAIIIYLWKDIYNRLNENKSNVSFMKVEFYVFITATYLASRSIHYQVV